MEEIWKDVVGYEGLYQASNLGRIRSCDRVIPIRSSIRYKDFDKIAKGKILKPNLNRGYHCVSLGRLGVIKNFQVHRLVAEAWIENPENKPEVNHKKGITTDNRVSELEWVTKGENLSHSFRVLGRSHFMRGKFGKNNIYSKKIKEIDLISNDEKTWDSLADAARFYSKNGNSGFIANCAKGRVESAYGKSWKYV